MGSGKKITKDLGLCGEVSIKKMDVGQNGRPRGPQM